MEYLSLIAKYVPVVVFGLLPIMNPLSTVPLFLVLTKGRSASYRQRQAIKASLYAFGILVTFLFVGNGIIALFGISLAGIRVAGGLIIMVLAFRMLFAGESEADSVEAEPAKIKQADVDFSFSPLAMPSLSGPGSIAVVMGYGSQIPDDMAEMGHAIVVMGIALTAAIAYLTLRCSVWLSSFLGQYGIQAVTKILGFLLACVAVQFIASGIRDFVSTIS
ncbi:MAG: MarC family NAAT transporter [Alphaproteobacteria bacterium]